MPFLDQATSDNDMIMTGGSAEGEVAMQEDVSQSLLPSYAPDDDTTYPRGIQMQGEALQWDFSTSTSAYNMSGYESTSADNNQTTITATSICDDEPSPSNSNSCMPKYLNKAVYSLAMAPKLPLKKPKRLKPQKHRNSSFPSALQQKNGGKGLSPHKIKPAIAPKSCTMYICIDSDDSSTDSNEEDTEVVVLQTSEEPTAIMADTDELTENQLCGDGVLDEGESWGIPPVK